MMSFLKAELLRELILDRDRALAKDNNFENGIYLNLYYQG
jgi:hypothetical protein